MELRWVGLMKTAAFSVGVLASALFLGGCEDPELPREKPTTPTVPGPGEDGFEVVVAASATIAGITPQNANNNLDVVRFQDRTFLAWRTGPTHFASPEVKLYVASEGADGWRYEGEFSLATDLREPRFLVLGDKLFLYFAVLGTNGTKFEPQGMKISEYQSPGSWTTPEDGYEPTFIPWRARVVNGTAYLIGYVGGEAIYSGSGNPIRIHFLKTADGRTFEPVAPGKPVVQEGGGSETDFAFLDDGSLVAVTRNEAGDTTGWGSKICSAPANDLGTWTCNNDKKKYDSPLVFRHGEDVWLVGRRNLSNESGNYDLDYDHLPPEEQTPAYLGEYSFGPKRCSLWKVDPAALAVEYAVDLPSRGDTCFASAVDNADGTVTIYNYSNELDGAPDCASWPDQCDDIAWFAGQGMPTIIYRTNVTFP